MCKILFNSQSFDEAYYLADRILAIEPDNEDAKSILNQIKEWEKDREWKKLKEANDIKSYVLELSKI